MATEGHLLVVDDDFMLRQMLMRLLVRQGYQVSTAGSVAEARSILARGGLDLVLTDLQMPGEDGLVLLGEVRQRYPTLPVVMLTAHGSMEVVVQALRLGANDFLTKPYQISELLAIVAREVRRYRQSLPPGVATQAGLQLSAELVEAIEQQIATLRADVNARAVLVIEGNGAVIAAKGAIEDLNVAALGALVAGDFAATAGIASLLGESAAFRLNYHEGKEYSIYSGVIVPGVFLLIVFTQDIKLGVVMYYAKETLAELQRVFDQAPRRAPVPQSAEPLPPAPAEGEEATASPQAELDTRKAEQTSDTRQAEAEEEAATAAPLFSLEEALEQGLIDPEIMRALDAHFGAVWQEK